VSVGLRLKPDCCLGVFGLPGNMQSQAVTRGKLSFVDLAGRER
jgi:hypothetical protein